MVRVIFINRVYWPAEEATAQLLHDLSAGLADSGMEVEVVTATGGPSSFTTSQGNRIAIHRLAQDGKLRIGIRAKASGYLAFLLYARGKLRQLIKPGDAVVSMTDPPLLGPAIGRIVRNRAGKMWHWSQDLYPEVAIAVAPFGAASAGLGLLQPWRNREWKNAQGIVTIGEDMADRVSRNQTLAERVHVVANWVPRGLVFHEAPAQRIHWGCGENLFIVAYAGNLGRAHVLTPLVSLAAACQKDEGTKFLIIGRGAQRANLENLVRDQRLGNITFFDPVPREGLGASLAAADLHVITMRPDCIGTVWPSKFYGVVAAGRPIVFIGPAQAEISQIITLNGLGLVVSPTDLSKARDFIHAIARDKNLYNSYQARVVLYAQSLKGLSGAVAAWHHLLTAS
jgi:colanic acid biosynthesis glycosyl transferase WcaI